MDVDAIEVRDDEHVDENFRDFFTCEDFDRGAAFVM